MGVYDQTPGWEDQSLLVPGLGYEKLSAVYGRSLLFPPLLMILIWLYGWQKSKCHREVCGPCAESGEGI